MAGLSALHSRPVRGRARRDSRFLDSEVRKNDSPLRAGSGEAKESSPLIRASLLAAFGRTVPMNVLTSRENLKGAGCFAFEEPGVGSEAEGFQEVGLHLL